MTGPGLGALTANLHATTAASSPRSPDGAMTFAERLASKTAPAPTEASRTSPVLEGAQRFVEAVSRDQSAIEHAVARATSGQPLTAGELLALQTRVYRFGRQVDLASKVVEKSVGTVRRIVDLQV